MRTRYLALALLLCTTVAWADPRPFVLSRDTVPEGKGNFQYEQGIDFLRPYWTDGDKSGHNDVWDFTHTLQWGVADNVDLRIKLADWQYTSSGRDTGADFNTSGIGAEVYLLDMKKSFLGLALTGDLSVGEDTVAAEFRTVLQKDVGPFNLVYNLALNATSGDDGGTEYIANDFGAYFKLWDKITVGGELEVKSFFEDWNSNDTGLSAGPTVGYQGKGWFVTVGPQFRIGDCDAISDWSVKALVGFEF